MNFENRDFENLDRKIAEVIEKYNYFLRTFGYYLSPNINLGENEKTNLVTLYENHLPFLKGLRSDIESILSLDHPNHEVYEEFETRVLMLKILNERIQSVNANLN